MRAGLVITTSFALICFGMGACSRPQVAEQFFEDKAITAEKVSADAAPATLDSSAGINAPTDASVAETDNNQTTNQQTQAQAPLLAYEYEMTVRLPLNKVGIQMRADLDKCIKAGPSNCQLITSRASEGDGTASAYLSFRAEAKWLDSFKVSIDKSAKENGGRIFSTSVSSEDLTLQITDTEARIRAYSALRSRLEKIIAERPGKLADLLEAEKELSRVQGDLDSLISQLAIARTRVQMSLMKIEYNSNNSAVTSSAFDPVTQAFGDFFYSMMQVFGFLINIVAVLIPIAIVSVPIIFLLHKFVARWKKKKQTPNEIIKEVEEAKPNL